MGAIEQEIMWRLFNKPVLDSCCTIETGIVQHICCNASFTWSTSIKMLCSLSKNVKMWMKVGMVVENTIRYDGGTRCDAAALLVRNTHIDSVTTDVSSPLQYGMIQHS